MHAKSLQWCLTLSAPMDCSLPGSSVHGILWARILEWAPVPSSRESSPPRDWTHIFYISCIAGGFTTTEPPGKPLIILPLITQSHTSSNCPISDNSSFFSRCLREKPLESSPPLPLPNTRPVHQQTLLILRLKCLQIPATPHFLHQHLQVQTTMFLTWTLAIHPDWSPCFHFCPVAQSLSCVWLFATPRTAAHQASLPSPSPGVSSYACPLILWCHTIILSSVVPFASSRQSSPASGSLPMSQLFASGGHNIGASASSSVLPMNIQDWFPLGLTSLISLQSKGLPRVFFSITVQKHQFFVTQPTQYKIFYVESDLLKTEIGQC